MPETVLLSASQILTFFYNSVPCTGTTPGLCMPGTTVLNNNARPAQLSPAIHSSAAQRRAVPFRALTCAAVLCRAALCFLSNMYSRTRYEMKYQVLVCTCCVLIFWVFLKLISLGPHVFPLRKLHPYCRSERHAVSKHTAQRRATSSAQAALGIINSLFAPNHGPLLSASITCFSCILPCASVTGGVSRPRSGAPVDTYRNSSRNHNSVCV